MVIFDGLAWLGGGGGDSWPQLRKSASGGGATWINRFGLGIKDELC